jgi:alpha-tubulin suppressor-like RCC1 family protein
MFGFLIFTLTASGLLSSSFKSVAQEDLGATGTTLAVGYKHSCVVTGAGNAKCWGWNLDGQTSVPGDLGRVTAISAGESHTCAVTEEGTVRCWGNNDAYQLDVPEDLGTDEWGKVTQISAGAYHTCALTQEWWVKCWGANGDDQTDQGSPYYQYDQITAGGYHTCGLKRNGEVKCWGDNSEGQSSARGFTDTVTQIEAGEFHNCAVLLDGEMQCWGDSSNQKTSIPAYAADLISVSSGGNHNCIIAQNGTAKCWGNNSEGQTNVPADLGKVSQISAGGLHSCAVQESGSVRCWGSNEDGQLLVPGGFGNASKVVAGENTTCVLNEAGDGQCWGYVVGIPRVLGKVADISVGTYHVCAMTTQTTIRCWGDNSYGQLDVPNGLGTIERLTTYLNASCAISNKGGATCWGEVDHAEYLEGILLDASSAFSGHYAVGGYGHYYLNEKHVCEVASTGLLNCWGNDSDGQAKVPDDLGTVIAVTAGAHHSCAITKENTVRCWGNNWLSQLDVPLALGNVTQISARDNTTCAVTSQGSVNCWGDMENGNIPNYESYGEPIQVMSFKKEFEVLTSPTIAGTGKVGTTLTAKPGNIIPTPDYTYQWFKFKKDWECWCKPIALGSTYIVKASDLGYSIAFTVTAKKSGYLDYSEDTKPKLVVAGSLFKTPSPKILGVAKVKQSVSTLTGSWDSGVTLSYQWLRNGVAISKATSAKYKLTAVDKGKKISVKVTGKKLGYQTVIKTSIPLNIK